MICSAKLPAWILFLALPVILLPVSLHAGDTETTRGRETEVIHPVRADYPEAFPHPVRHREEDRRAHHSDELDEIAVLLIGDGSTELTLTPLLEDNGSTVTLVDGDASYTGDNPAPDDFGVVVITDGLTYMEGMPENGQRALLEYVESGGGLIVTEWVAYEFMNNRYRILGEIFPIPRTSGREGPETYTVIEEHEITEGVDEEFDVQTGSNIGQATSGTVLVTGSSAGDALAIDEIENGRIVQFACAGNYAGFDPFTNDNMELLFLNAVQWALAGTFVEGTVTDAVTGEPLPGVAVSIYNLTADSLHEIDTTDAEGFYSNSSPLAEGEYFLHLEKPLYVDIYSDTFEVTDPAQLEMNFAMQPFLLVNIEEIQTELAEDTWVKTYGIVTQPTNSTTTGQTSFYIQDNTGFGVHVYEETPWNAEEHGELARGDSLLVIGRVTEMSDITTITDLYHWERISSGNPVYDPISMSTGAMAWMQDMEGSWAHIEGYMVDDPAPGDYCMRFDDGSGACWTMIHDETGIDLLQYHSGDWQLVNGVITLLFGGTVVIVPSLVEDVWRTPTYAPTHFVGYVLDREEGSGMLEWALMDYDELDGFLEFVVYRYDEEIAQTWELSYIDHPPLGEPPHYFFYEYHVSARYHEGEFSSDTVTINFEREHSSGESLVDPPGSFAITTAWPNPFNPRVTIAVALPEAGNLRVEVFNRLGRKVALITDSPHPAGFHEFIFDAGELAAGLYFVRASVPGREDVLKKIVFAK